MTTASQINTFDLEASRKARPGLWKGIDMRLKRGSKKQRKAFKKHWRDLGYGKKDRGIIRRRQLGLEDIPEGSVLNGLG